MAAIGGGGPLGLLLGRLADDDLDALRLMKGLVELGLLEVVYVPPDDRWQDKAAPVPGVSDLSRLEAPLVLVRAPEPVARTTDPALQHRLDALAAQFDAVYEAQAAAIDEAEASSPRTRLFGKLRHRPAR